jgi:hypothetical protein
MEGVTPVTIATEKEKDLRIDLIKNAENLCERTGKCYSVMKKTRTYGLIV